MAIFKKGAWLHTLIDELSEKEFIEKAGGTDALRGLGGFPYVSLVLDKDEPLLIGHRHGSTIAMTMRSNGHKSWQTMEWK